jgi:hypothetical protein
MSCWRSRPWPSRPLTWKAWLKLAAIAKREPAAAALRSAQWSQDKARLAADDVMFEEIASACADLTPPAMLALLRAVMRHADGADAVSAALRDGVSETFNALVAVADAEGAAFYVRGLIDGPDPIAPDRPAGSRCGNGQTRGRGLAGRHRPTARPVRSGPPVGGRARDRSRLRRIRHRRRPRLPGRRARRRPVAPRRRERAPAGRDAAAPASACVPAVEGARVRAAFRPCSPSRRAEPTPPSPTWRAGGRQDVRPRPVGRAGGAGHSHRPAPSPASCRLHPRRVGPGRRGARGRAVR